MLLDNKAVITSKRTVEIGQICRRCYSAQVRAQTQMKLYSFNLLARYDDNTLRPKRDQAQESQEQWLHVPSEARGSHYELPRSEMLL